MIIPLSADPFWTICTSVESKVIHELCACRALTQNPELTYVILSNLRCVSGLAALRVHRNLVRHQEPGVEAHSELANQ